MAKEKLIQITTPAGTASFPKLNKPETEINGKPLDKPRFSVGLILDEKNPGVSELKAQLVALHKEAIDAAEKKRKADPKRKNKPLTINPPFRAVLDDEGNEVEGQFEIRSKTSAETKDGAPKQVRMFDAKGKPTTAKVGGGSVLKLAVSPSAYDSSMGAGLALYLNAVQVIELRSFGGGNAGAYGFGQEEGYEESGETEGGEPAPDDAATGGEEAPPAPRAKNDF